MSRFVHAGLIALGIAGTVLAYLGTIPKYAGFAAAAALLVGDAKKILVGKVAS